MASHEEIKLENKRIRALRILTDQGNGIIITGERSAYGKRQNR